MPSPAGLVNEKILRRRLSRQGVLPYTISMTVRKTLLLGVSGASGMPLALRFLGLCRALPGLELHLIVSPGAEAVLRAEGGPQPDELIRLAHVVHAADDMAAPPASGSWRHDGMIIAPCSMNTLGALAAGVTANLLQRAADVCLKERRPLVLVTRESPLSRIHLRNMLTLQEAGAVIMPFSPGFYLHPRTLDEMLDQFCGRILDQVAIDHPLGRWGGGPGPQTTAHKERP